MANAEAGSVKAMFNVALFFNMGTGVGHDARMAAKWYTRAAEAGNARAQYKLGLCYRDGTGVARDFSAARRWLTRAAAAGVARASAALAQLDADEAAQ